MFAFTALFFSPFTAVNFSATARKRWFQRCFINQWNGLHFVNHHHQTWWQEDDWINYFVCLHFSNKPTFTFIDLLLMKWQSIEKISSTPPRDWAKPTRQIKIKYQTFNNFCNTGPIWKTSIEYCSINCNWSINQLLVKSKLSTINCTAIAIFHIRIEDFSVNFSRLTSVNW